MPYSRIDEVPDYVPKDKRRQWMSVFNSAHAAAKEDGKSDKEAEESAFAQANAMAGPNSDKTTGANMKANIGSTDVHYTAQASVAAESCRNCLYFDPAGNRCLNDQVKRDPNVPKDARGQKIVSPGGWCDQFETKPVEVTGGDGTLKAQKGRYSKFIPFIKVDAAKREVWGIVTAEVPDKEDEVCDYEKSKPYYKAVIDEMAKATDGKNFFPLREMHQLSAVGKGIGFEFRDQDKEIFMGFKVVDDDAWHKIDEGVYTGFSQGGSKVSEEPDPVYKGCTRYVANPSEVSVVDNPCLGVAHFTYVKLDGSVELRKFKKTEEAVTVPLTRLSVLIDKAITSRTNVPVAKGGKTKRVAGEDLPSSAFAYVGDANDTSTWKLPIKFSTDAKTKSHIRNALSRFNQTQGIPSGERSKVYQRIVSAAKQHGIDVSDEKALISRIHKLLRTAARIQVNRIHGSVASALAKLQPRPHVLALDDDLGRLQKGMYEVSRLAQCVESVGYLVYAVANEQQWEGDADSPLPEMVAENVNGLMDTLLAMVKEETDEMREEITMRLKASETGAGMAAEVAASPVSSL